MFFTIITPTYNRKNSFKKLCNQLNKQTFRDFGFITVDSSHKIISIKNYENFLSVNCEFNNYIFSLESGSSLQRNLGLEKILSEKVETNWVLYIDDDIEFSPTLLEDAHKYIVSLNKEESDILAIGPLILSNEKNSYNLNTSLVYLARKFFSKVFDYLNFYSIKKGSVAISGWHSKHSLQKNEINKVEWLPTGFLIVKLSKSTQIKYDEQYMDYGYLEDLDFTYTLSKKGILIRNNNLIVETAIKEHSSFLFGISEIKNRLYFVKKHNLSLFNYSIMMFIRMVFSLYLSLRKMDLNYLKRLFGNFSGIFNYYLKHNYFLKKIKNNNLSILIDVSNSRHGGGASFLHDLAFTLSLNNKLNIDMLILDDNVLDLSFSNKIYKINRFFLLRDISKFFLLKKIYDNYDCVIAGGAQFVRDKTIFISQNNISIDPNALKLFNFIQRLQQIFIKYRVYNAVNKSLFSIAPSIESKNLLINIGLDKNKIIKIYNFATINSVFLDQKNNDYLYEVSRKFNFLYISNYAPHKGHINLIKAFSKLKKLGYNFHLECVGKWSFDGLKKIIEGMNEVEYLGPSHLLLTNEVSRDYIYKKHLESNIFIFPSACESGSMSLIEALKFGKPILSSNMSSNKEYAEDAPLYFNPLLPDSIVDNIKKIFINPSILKEMSNKSLIVSKKFDEKALTNDLLDNITGYLSN